MKRIVLVGASSGIGAELALQYAKKGNKIVVAARRLERLQEVVNKCKELGAADAVAITCDATSFESCGELIEKSVEAFGGIDIVYYVCGIAMHVLFEDITDIRAVHKQIMGVNFDGAVWITYHALPHLKKVHGQICYVSSVASKISPPFLTLYSSAKHALNGFAESLQNEDPGVDVTIVLPGYVKTEIDDKKVVGDGSIQSVELNTNQSEYMAVETATSMIIDAVKARKKEYHLTLSGSLGATFHALLPGMINSAVKNEMKRITKKKEKKNKSSENTKESKKEDSAVDHDHDKSDE